MLRAMVQINYNPSNKSDYPYRLAICKLFRKTVNRQISIIFSIVGLKFCYDFINMTQKTN